MKKFELPRRHSVSFSQEQLDALATLAQRNHVSVAWIVRLAVSEFLDRHQDGQLSLALDSQRA